MNDIPKSDVFCRYCGTRMDVEKLKCPVTYSQYDGSKEDSGIYVFTCPKYNLFWGIFGGHQQFKSEWQYRHSSWN